MKPDAKYIKMFLFGSKCLFLLLALTVPVILGLGLINLSCNILRATSLYEEPLQITHIWATRNVRRIRGIDLENDPSDQFSITISGITVSFIAKLNRQPKNEKEEKEIAGQVAWECSKGSHKKETVKEMTVAT